MRLVTGFLTLHGHARANAAVERLPVTPARCVVAEAGTRGDPDASVVGAGIARLGV